MKILTIEDINSIFTLLAFDVLKEVLPKIKIAERALNELSKINNIDNESKKKWIERYWDFVDFDLLMFRVEVDYKENSENEDYFEIGSNFLIPKEPFRSLIEIQKIHYKLVEEIIPKKPRDTNEKKGYYDPD